MRLATPVVSRSVLSLAVVLGIAASAAAQSNKQYGTADFDPDKVFGGVTSKPYGGAAAPAASRPATPPPTNDLRVATPSRPASRPTKPAASRPPLDLPPMPGAGKPAAPKSPPPALPPKRDPFAKPARSLDLPPTPKPSLGRNTTAPAPRNLGGLPDLGRTPPPRPQVATAPPQAKPTRPTRPAAPPARDLFATPSAPAASPLPASPPARPRTTVSTPPPPAQRRPQVREQRPTSPSRSATAQVDAREGATHRTLERMLRLRDHLRDQSQLRGAPTSLAQVISTATSREDQARRVDAYWALTSAVADYYLSLSDRYELQDLRNKESTYNQTLSSAYQKISTRVGTALKAAQSAQYRLARLTGSPAMPLPSDVPFTGRYHTRLNEMFPGGVPAEARLLDELLPLRLAELRDAADDLVESEDWVARVRKQRASSKSAEGVVKALKLNALNRRAFVQLARDYNLQINRYTQLAKPEPVDTGRLVAMLIRERPLLAQAGPGRLNNRPGDQPRR